ncbi:hypothetical protein [Streptomyces sp. NPDC006446]|uniref:hypothetical protein n=1 Tax=Streptomyces sp. NPDC006446 TaxID=3154301 RepID=UPI0033BC299E
MGADDFRCCLCGGQLLFRGRPFKPGLRSWLSRSRRLLDEVEYDHAAGCEASRIPAGLLIALDRDQALAEAVRRREPPGGACPPSAS